MKKDALWSHIHRKQFKKVIEDEVFEKRKKKKVPDGVKILYLKNESFV
jgi:hypothetical protein